MTPGDEHSPDEWRWALVGRVAHGVLHDLNNFLGTITTLSELLLMDAEPESEIAQDLGEIKESAWLAATTAKKLQMLGGALGKGASTEEPSTDVAAAMRDLEFLLRRLVPSGAALEIDAPDSVHLPVHRHTFDEAMLALAVEARGTLKGGATFRVEMRIDGSSGATDSGQLSVEVTAPGLGSEDGIGGRAAARLAREVGGRLEAREGVSEVGSVRVSVPYSPNA